MTIRQFEIIMLKRFIIITLISSILTIFCWTVGIFISGIDLLLLPLMIALVLFGISGLLTIPLGLYKFFRRQPFSKTLVTLIAISIGYFCGYFLEKPIYKWDEQQRNISGQILTAEIEKFKSENEFYPSTLKQLNVDKLNSELPKTYQLHKFSYHKKDDSYDLDIPIPIVDRWHWERIKQQFIYDDF
jgi:ABC-type multidrug transport system permease subunit